MSSAVSESRASRTVCICLSLVLCLSALLAYSVHLKQQLESFSEVGAIQLPSDAERGGSRETIGPEMWPGGDLRLKPEAFDGLMWLHHAEKMQQNGLWRIPKWTYSDNFPEGRPIFWSSAIAWLALFGGEATPYLLAFMHLALVCVVPVIAWRDLGWLASAWLAVGLLTIQPILEQFSIGQLDHHGPVLWCIVLGLLFLLLALIAEEGSKRGLKYACFSAGALGVGMWLSAASVVPLILVISVGVLILSPWLYRRPDAGDPGIWRVWAYVGGGVSFAFYLLEYFPGHLHFRLEVNSPLLTLSWICAGEVLPRLIRAVQRFGTEPVFQRSDYYLLPLLCFLGLLPLICIPLLGDAVFQISDDFSRLLHRDHIDEFDSLFQVMEATSLPILLVSFSGLPLLLPVALLQVNIARSNRLSRMILFFAIISAVFCFLAAWQIRWISLALAVLLLLGAVCCAQVITQSGWRKWVLGGQLMLAASLAFLPWPIYTISNQGDPNSVGMGRDTVFQLVEEDVAKLLRLRAGLNDLVVLASPSASVGLMYYADAHVLGTNYWENMYGLKHAAAIFSAQTEEAFRKAVTDAGITHIVLYRWSHFTGHYVRLHKGLALEDSSPMTYLRVLFARRSFPGWMRPMHYQLPAGFGQEFTPLIVEILPNPKLGSSRGLSN